MKYFKVKPDHSAAVNADGIRNSLISFMLLVATFCVTGVYAQNENNIWYFGDECGLDFNSGSPVALTNGVSNQPEGVASVADSAGNLLFFTDGISVWNRNHLVMPNGLGLKGHGSSTHSATIAPDPGNAGQYYIFTCPEQGLPDSFCYSKVDMSLAGGFGDVTMKNFGLLYPANEKCITAVKPGSSDLWIVNHDKDSSFYSWPLTPAGLGSPVVSVVPLSAAIAPQLGYLKISSSGNKLAEARYVDHDYILYDFDQFTGIVSNPIVLAESYSVYGLEFSPDGTKLYAYPWEPNSASPTTIYQYDITSGNASTIQASKIVIGVIDHGGVGCAQIGPDLKIYITVNAHDSLAVISYPDSAATACGFVANGIYLAGKISRIGLPAIVKFPNAGLTIPSVNLASSDTLFCDKNCIDFYDLSTNNPTSWQWFFPGADSTSSNMQNPTGICYNSYGSFDVTLIACNAAGCDTMFLPGFINEFQNPPVPVITMNPDTLFSTPAFSYQWYQNSAPIAGATNQYYVFQQMGTYFVIVTDSNGCASSSSSMVLTTGINEANNESISVYPNPADGNFIISGAPLNSEINIYNVTGQLIYSTFTGTGKLQLQIKAVDGIYFLEIISPGHLFRKKIVVNK